MVRYLNKPEIHFIQGCFVPIWLNWPSGSTEDFFFINVVNVFFNLVIITPWKLACLFILMNLNPHHPSMICAKLVEIGPVVLEKKTHKFRHCVFAIS